MKISKMIAIAFGVAALAACGESATEQTAENMDANLAIPVDNFDTMDANAANTTMDVNLDADANMTADNADLNADANAAANTAY